MSPRPTANNVFIALSGGILALLLAACTAAAPAPRPAVVIVTQIVEKEVSPTQQPTAAPAMAEPTRRPAPTRRPDRTGTEKPTSGAPTPSLAPTPTPTPALAPIRRPSRPILPALTPAPTPTSTPQLPITGGGGPEFPEFPWPPPQPSSLVVVPCKLPEIDAPTLGNVDDRLRAALDATGYYDLAYFLVPNGFALVTRLEQINADGRPKNPPARWNVDIEPMEEFSLAAYVRALFTATPGHYRVIVFAVTDTPIVTSGEPVDSAEAEGWLAQGADVLPEPVYARLFTDAYHVTALIYQFRQPGQGGKVVQLIENALPGRQHLEAAQLWSLIAR